ncbi:MAG TPA: PSD1 and planctomycete cytochrome C domain-containing protein [Bryobacteraceae bacterium]|nr:PSD1 and planctomycete cytochrome C domain-containing protein [Bryobacteraceae bacterium]
MRRIPILLVALCAGSLSAQESESLFTNTIRPLFEKECTGCHGNGLVLSKLDMRSREGLLKGGAHGAAITPGKAAESLLVKLVEGNGPVQMPPGEASKRLPAEAVAAIRRWIDTGAAWPTTVAKDNWGQYKDEDLWAFRPLRRKWDTGSSIDSFLPAAPAADRRTLIRRVSFDLTGLPPTPEEVAAFIKDKSPDAYPRLVERLLASPRYGERWGRHWLDVVRYADSGGYSNDFERPNAWRYRDYVIRSFQQDKSYDQFIREQVAGDEMDANNGEFLIATGFLRAGPWEHTAMSVEAVTRQLFLDDVTHATASTFLGLTLGCARCHDHKFDPLPTRDYYRFQAVFATTEFARPKVEFLASENTAGMEAGRAHMRQVIAETQLQVDRFDMKKKDVDPEKFEEFKLFQKHMQLYKQSADRFEPKAFCVSSGPRDGATDGGPTLKYPSLTDYKAPRMHILTGGNIQSPAAEVQPGVLSLLARYGNYPEPEIPTTVTGRRLALARWIADERNPLTARVMVNRIWQHHFGAGIAADPSNFGKMGKKPTHPELLDWLASYFIDHGWSVKAVHRAILLSKAYQSATLVPPRRLEAEELRDSILAVSGELSLSVGGPGTFPQINDDVARQPRHAMGSLQPLYRASARKSDRHRRSIYSFQQRSLVDPMIEVFNGPSMDLSCERRESSTIPTQSFALFNAQFVNDMALALAARLEREERTPEARIERAFQLAFARPPTAEELRMVLAHWRAMTKRHAATPPPAKPRPQRVVHTIMSELTGERHQFTHPEDPAEFEANLHSSEVSAEVRAMADVALTLLNSNEFVYVY